MGESSLKYEKYRDYVSFIDKYKKAENASTGSKYDSNANVDNKNIATMQGEIPKGTIIGINRLLMHDKIQEMYGKGLADEYIRQLESHEIYKHDETSVRPYCVSITMYPFLIHGLKAIGGMSEPPKHLDSFCGSFINLVFAVASQFAGAVSTPEFLTYLDYFIRKEYGDDYYLHSEDIAILSVSKKTIEDVIKDKFAQVVYSLNQPAAARDFQSVFWNISYFDKNYFDGIFKDFCFPDGTEPKWDSVSWLQKNFMKWFNAERLKKVLTFPVETMNLLDNGENYVDEEWADFTAEMYSEGHSFFTYRSNSVDSLSSCCFDGSQKTLTRSSVGVNYMTFKDLYESSGDTKKNFRVFHNGSWVGGKPIRLPAKNLLKVTTANNKELLVTVDHLNPTLRGDIRADALTVDDYLLTNSCVLNSIPEKDRKLTYEQGFLIGMYLGDGSIGNDNRTVMLSLNKTKYLRSEKILNDALEQMGLDIHVHHHKEQHNVYPTPIHSREVVDFVREYVDGNYGNEKHLNLDCLMQSVDFRKGILDGYYVTDGGNSNRIYTTSAILVDDIEALMTSIGLNSIINVSDRTDEPVVIRGETCKRNYPLYCIRWYKRKNKRCMPPIYKTVNNSTYFKIKSIEPYKSDEKYVYCFEMPEDEPYFTLPNGIITHNCRLKNEIKDNTFSFTLGAGGVSTGSKGVITMNVNRIVQNAVRSGRDISECVREQVDKIHCYLMAYNEIIKDYLKSNMLPVYNAGFIGLDRQYLTIGINGYVEGAEFLGIEISPNDEYFKYGETILRPIYESNRAARTSDAMFNTEFVPAENLGVKNALWDKEDGYFVPRDCYNSYFYIVEDETCNVLDKFILHGDRLTKFLDGGSALHCNLDEHLSKSQYRKLMDVAIETGCSYFTYNIPNTICNKCGHITKHHLDYCEVCGSEDVDYITRIIGYLKRVSAFSAARQEEAKERYYAKP